MSTTTPLAAWAATLPEPPHRAVLGVSEEPARAAARLAEAGLGAHHVVYEQSGTWHFAAGSATFDVTATGATARHGERSWHVPAPEGPLAAVRAALAALRAASSRDRTVHGWAAFELAHLLHGDPARAGTEPLLSFLVPSVEITLRPGKAEVRAGDPAVAARAATVLGAEARSATAPQPAPFPATAPLPEAAALLAADPGGYRASVAATSADIRAGLLDKAVVSRVVPLPRLPDLGASYVTGRAANTPARSFLLDLGGWRAAGFSPETVVEVGPEGEVSTQPLAGTRARTGEAAEDTRLRAELYADPKEVQEHALSVRLACEELARVCVRGSVAVTEFMAVRERGSVQHLASRVAGRLEGGSDAWTAFGALFPAITATGVPKAAALDALGRHERGPRGLYGGAVFRSCTSGALDAALVLRAVLVRGDRAWLRAGAGVMGVSTPAREFDETREKLLSVAPHLRFPLS
ncbi:salicylate synthase [Streptomyces sp. CA-253872]|uniref:salicylate synthase n=1 Tax=Streptomyces sp. CA-253872 TaxID=3240067 RepID=UPI003D89B326